MSPTFVPTFMLPEALKAQQWEIAKGHLRALVILQGSYSGRENEYQTIKWQRLEDEIEAFIKKIEGESLAE